MVDPPPAPQLPRARERDRGPPRRRASRDQQSAEAVVSGTTISCTGGERDLSFSSIMPRVAARAMLVGFVLLLATPQRATSAQQELNVQLWGCDGRPSQRWALQHDGRINRVTQFCFSSDWRAIRRACCVCDQEIPRLEQALSSCWAVGWCSGTRRSPRSGCRPARWYRWHQIISSRPHRSLEPRCSLGGTTLAQHSWCRS